MTDGLHMTASKTTFPVRHNNRGIAPAAYAVTAISVFGASAISPVLPMIGRDFRVGDASTSLLISMFILPMAVLTPLAGMAAEKISLKSLLVACLVLYAVGAAACYVAPGFTSLLIFRILQGVGAAALELFGLVMLIEATPPNLLHAAISRNAAVIGISTAVAPLVSGVIALVSWRATFIPGLLALPLALLVLSLKFPRAPQADNEGLPLSDLLLRRPVLVSLALIFVTFFFLFGILLSFVPALARADHVTSPLFASALPALSAVSISFIAPITGKMFHQGHVTRATIIGLGVYTLAMCSYVLSSAFGVAFLVLGCMLVGAGHGLLFPLAQALMARQAPAKGRILFMSFNITAIGISQTLAPLISSAIDAVMGLMTVFVSAGALGIGCIFLAVAARSNFITAGGRQSQT